MSRPYRVGLTGGAGCGKSAAAAVFERLGVPVLDADAIARDLTRPGRPALRRIAAAFGEGILDEAGALRRDALRRRVFAGAEDRRRLEALLHPLVYEALEEAARRVEAPYCVLMIPLLVETGAAERVDTVLVVDCPEDLQVRRVRERDGVSDSGAKAILRAQAGRAERLQAADEVILNDAGLDALEDAVRGLHQEYLRRAQGARLDS